MRDGIDSANVRALAGASTSGADPTDQILAALLAAIAREHGISEAKIYTWKSKYSRLEVSEAQRLKSLEDENRRLKHLVADLSLDKEVLKAIVRKIYGPPLDCKL